MDNILRQKDIKICYLDNDKKFISHHKAKLETIIKLIGNINFFEIYSLEDPTLNDADLLIISALTIDNTHFKNWFLSLHKQIINKGKIWIPALIYSNLSFNDLEPMIPEFINTNWYFDIILTTEELESIPIRLANLIKIKEHLCELKRYNDMIEELEQKITNLEKEILITKSYDQ